MRLGIKYCGGCNSRYDRVAETQKLLRHFSSWDISYDTNIFCDIWALICGCPAHCPVNNLPVAKLKVFIIDSPRKFSTLAAYMKQVETMPIAEVPPIKNKLITVKLSLKEYFKSVSILNTDLPILDFRTHLIDVLIYSVVLKQLNLTTSSLTKKVVQYYKSLPIDGELILSIQYISTSSCLFIKCTDMGNDLICNCKFQLKNRS